MEEGFYRTGQFARRARVSERTLRYYDKMGLLSPSYYTEAGYRMYTEDDYPRLQQILGLKYLGFSLEEIHAFLKHGPRRFKEALAIQKAMMQERKVHLEKIIRTIEETERRLAENSHDWSPILQVIEVIQMTEKNEWVSKYFNDEQLKKLNEISDASYNEADKRKIAEWGKDWSEADQRQADEKWNAIYAEARRLADAGADPAGDEAQALAARQMALVGEFTRGDPGVTAGLKKFWQNVGELPEGRSPLPKVLTDAQQAFLDKALEVYHQRQNS
jgi:DNA-binding transcriptional MerR regulator